jgi:hypothetical protein
MHIPSGSNIRLVLLTDLDVQTSRIETIACAEVRDEDRGKEHVGKESVTCPYKLLHIVTHIVHCIVNFQANKLAF